MAQKKKGRKPSVRGSARARPTPKRSASRGEPRPLAEEELQGPPPPEVLREPTDLERASVREAAEHSGTSPRLTGGDPDADWQRAHLSGEEAVGGTAATPNQNVVDDLGDALGVPRAPDEEVRSSAEILDARDARRGHNEE